MNVDFCCPQKYAFFLKPPNLRPERSGDLSTFFHKRRYEERRRFRTEPQIQNSRFKIMLGLQPAEGSHVRVRTAGLRRAEAAARSVLTDRSRHKDTPRQPAAAARSVLAGRDAAAGPPMPAESNPTASPQPSGWACTSGPAGREAAALRRGGRLRAAAPFRAQLKMKNEELKMIFRSQPTEGAQVRQRTVGLRRREAAARSVLTDRSRHKDTPRQPAAAACSVLTVRDDAARRASSFFLFHSLVSLRFQNKKLLL